MEGWVVEQIRLVQCNDQNVNRDLEPGDREGERVRDLLIFRFCDLRGGC